MFKNIHRLTLLTLVVAIMLGLSLTVAGAQEATQEPAVEITEEPIVEPTAPVEVTAEPTVEPTAPPEVTVEPTVEVTAEPTATEESTAEATGEPTEVTPTEEPELPLEELPALSLLLYDNFDSGAATNWVFSPGWWMSGGVMQADNTAAAITSQPSFLPAPAQFFNVGAQARFQLSSGSVQLSVRANGPVAYTADIYADGLVMLLRGGVPVEMATVEPMADWRDARIVAFNSTVRVFIDGVEVIGWADAAPLPPGGVNIAPVFAPQPTDGTTRTDSLLVEDFVLWVPTAELGNYPQPTAVPTEVTATLEPTVEATVPAEVTAEPTAEATPELIDPATGKSLALNVYVAPGLAAPPANDNFASPVSVGGLPFTHNGTTNEATTEVDEATLATCGFNVSATVWFSFNPPANGSYTINTNGTAWDTVLNVYHGSSLATLTQDACNDDAPGSLQSALTIPLNAGTVYYIRVGGYNGNAGDYTLNVQNTGVAMPLAPGLGSPTNKQVVGNNAGLVTFDWSDATNAVSYEIHVSNNTNFTSLQYQATVTPSTVSQNIPDGKWYWRVRGLNINGQPGPWSAKWLFTQDKVAPLAPVLLSPVDAAVVNTNRPTLKWKLAATATGYLVDLDDNLDFSSPILNDKFIKGTSLPLNPTNLGATPLAQGEYYWRVQALDAGGNPSVETEVISFNVNLAKTPANNGNFVSATSPGFPNFTWTASGLPVPTYGIEVDNNSDFSSPEYSVTGLTGVSHKVPNTELDLVHGAWFWRVTPYSNGVPVLPPPGLFNAFSITPSNPPKPVQTAPANNATISATTPLLDWNPPAANVAGAPFEYIYEISSTNTFVVLEQSGTVVDHQFQLIDPLPDGKWFWRVRVVNTFDALSAWSVRSFTVDTLAKQKAPKDGAVSLNTRPAFSWDGVPGANFYRLVIANTEVALTTSTTYLYEGSALKFTPPTASPLALGTYFWRVDHSFDGGATYPDPSDSVFDFIVSSALLAPPVITLPANNGAIADLTPAIQWSFVAGNNGFRYQIASDNKFKNIVHSGDVGVNVTQSDPPASDLPEGRYYARVYTLNAQNAPGKPSKTGVFFIDVTAPTTAPKITTPKNGVTTTDSTPTISWGAVTGAVRYDVRFDTVLPLDDSDIPLLPLQTNGNDITARSYTPALHPLIPDTYYFQVRAIDAAGNESNWSDVLSIKIVSVTNAAPIPNRFAVPRPDLTWTPISWATFYEVEISTTSNFSNIVDESDTIPAGTLTYSPDIDLPVGQYFWRVRAKNGSGVWGGWSSTGTFLVDQ